MNISPEKRPQVKAECLRLLTTLRLDPARMQLISGFIDTYLNLNETEEQKLNSHIEQHNIRDRISKLRVLKVAIVTWY
ncbi:hypothetical protein [Nostoc sp.]|uniref:hypothetical protein n=1 Tax=Nostoc sp. TaxID=1180 RepID=UPI002FFA384F